MTTSTWRPLLDPEAAAVTLAVAREILAHTPTPARCASPDYDFAFGSDTTGSLAGGFAGLALWLAYAQRCGLVPARARQRAMLARADACLVSETLLPGLHSGFTGIAWTHAHLDLLRGTPGATDVEAIDDALIEALDGEWTRDYDLIEGLVGFGVYALERLPSASGARLLDLVVSHLQRRSVQVPSGTTWFTPPRLLAVQPDDTPRPGHYNLGLAHGVPGVIGFLGAAASAHHAPARRLLEAAVPWLLAHERPADAGGGFAAWLESGDAVPEPARLAWCYGDAGIAAALMLAADGAGRDDWHRAALRLARRAASRPVETSGVVDAMVCHGAAGLGHIFNRLWQRTGEPWLADAARTWLARALAFRQPDRGIAGFDSWAVDDAGQVGWRRDPGVLTGAAGVGLVLLAAATSVAPDWDRAFLLSCRRDA